MPLTPTTGGLGGEGAGAVSSRGGHVPMIEIDGLRKLYGQFEALRGISFTVYRGEVVGFLGPNGAGKSTTMKVMTGLVPPTAGTARVAGHDVLDDPIEVRRAIGFLPEHPPLYPEMIVRDYLSFTAEIRGIPRRRRQAAVDAAIELCGLQEVHRRLVGNLSKGYRQRTGLAQAVIHEPRILILDEPTVGLDPTQVVEIRGIIRDIGRERTVILSSHILPEVQATCERVVIINRGRLVADGRMDEILATGGEKRVLVRLRRPPDDGKAIEALDGVESVEDQGEGLFRLELEAGAERREAVVAALAASGWGLYEVRSETTSLEEVFRDVVLEEAAP
ncbi:MAG: ATP-binding cassette domain-containing protein [Acidobacteriota bacterium]|nr:ATP-binding cassette domain-containing protein [Acidobacteriota bacterium]